MCHDFPLEHHILIILIFIPNLNFLLFSCIKIEKEIAPAFLSMFIKSNDNSQLSFLHFISVHFISLTNQPQ